MSTKKCLGIFYFAQILSLLSNGFSECEETRQFIFANNSGSKQNKKNPEHSFVGNIKQETCAKFQKKILKSTVVGARQGFDFPDKIAGFLKTINDDDDDDNE